MHVAKEQGFWLILGQITFLLGLAVSREITFPSVAPIEAYGQLPIQQLLSDSVNKDEDYTKFAGLQTYANIPWVHCLSSNQEIEKYDIAILGAPFDTATTARPGARFGPSGIRWGSRRIVPDRAWSAYTHENHFMSWARIIDCGDAPLTFLDNTVALKQLGQAHKTVSGRKANATERSSVPRIVTLGGDHTTTLAALRSTINHWGPVSVIHFDSHLDTWNPKVLGGGVSHYAGVNHGTFLHLVRTLFLTALHTASHYPSVSVSISVIYNTDISFLKTGS